MEALYADINGRQLRKSEWDHHHIHDRSTAQGKGKLFRAFINRMGLLVPIVKVEHVKINQLQQKPPLPTASLISRINMHADRLPPLNPYDTFLEISDFIHTVAERCPNTDHRKQAGHIAESYRLQTPFILAGQVHPLEPQP